MFVNHFFTNFASSFLNNLNILNILNVLNVLNILNILNGFTVHFFRIVSPGGPRGNGRQLIILFYVVCCHVKPCNARWMATGAPSTQFPVDGKWSFHPPGIGWVETKQMGGDPVPIHRALRGWSSME